MTLDLTQFHDAFFEESFEALDSMEAALLKLDLGAPDSELINTIFRVAHSIKGGSATFGFTEIASFTHSLETLLDELRSNKLQVTSPTLDLLLKSVDAMRDMLRAVQTKTPIDSQRVADLQFDAEQILARKDAAPAPAATTNGASTLAAPASASSSTPAASAASTPAAALPAVAPISPQRHWKISFRPYLELFARGNDPLRMLRELKEHGTLQVETNFDALPGFKTLEPQNCYLSWNLELTGDVAEEAIREVFDWATGDCDLDVVEVAAAAAAAPAVDNDLINHDLIAEFDAMMASDAAPKYAPVVATPSARTSDSAPAHAAESAVLDAAGSGVRRRRVRGPR